MKKEERLSFIHKEVYRLAKTGKYSDWSSIEIALIGNGFNEARRVLENERMRKELDELCSRVRSETEIQNRNLFSSWLGNFIEQNKANISAEFPDISIYLSQEYFSISSNKKGYEIRKEFGSRKLVGDYIFEETDGKRYRTFNSYNSQKDFDEFTRQDLKDLAKNISS